MLEAAGGGRRRTWVLGGGGARGAAQVGALLALFEAGLEPPARVIGTSIGALNGASIPPRYVHDLVGLLHQLTDQ